jgi:hypothetical protein
MLPFVQNSPKTGIFNAEKPVGRGKVGKGLQKLWMNLKSPGNAAMSKIL